jgi:hypothetical protein
MVRIKIDKKLVNRKLTTSIVFDKKVHRRIRELTDFNHGGFSVLLNTSLRVFLPFVEMYYLEHKRSLKDCDVLQTIFDDFGTRFDYETIGRNFVLAIRDQTKKGFNYGE